MCFHWHSISGRLFTFMWSFSILRTKTGRSVSGSEIPEKARIRKAGSGSTTVLVVASSWQNFLARLAKNLAAEDQIRLLSKFKLFNGIWWPFLFKIGRRFVRPIKFFIRPLLSYAAEQSASWQNIHCLFDDLIYKRKFYIPYTFYETMIVQLLKSICWELNFFKYFANRGLFLRKYREK